MKTDFFKIMFAFRLENSGINIAEKEEKRSVFAKTYHFL